MALVPPIVLGAVILLAFEIVVVTAGFLLRRWLPLRGRLWHAAHGTALRVEHEGHDVVAEVEWPDERVTYMGADYVVDDEALVLKNGLKIKIRGRGAEPVHIAGVPIIRVRAEHACPVDSDVAIAMELEDEGEYDRVTTRDVDDAAPATPTGPGGDGAQPEGVEAAADGGRPLGREGPPVDHIYDLESPDGYDGSAFSLRTAIEYVPNAISPLDLKRAEERGKEAERQGYSDLRVFLMGMGAMFLVIVLAAVLFIAFIKLTSGSSIGMLLPLLAAPATRRGENDPAGDGGRGRAAALAGLRAVWRALPTYLLGFVLGVILLNQRILLDAVASSVGLQTQAVVLPVLGSVSALGYLSVLYELAAVCIAYIVIQRSLHIAREEYDTYAASTPAAAGPVQGGDG